MKVYRYLTQSELNNILAGKMDNIGSNYSCKDYKMVNSHKYKTGEKYLHFYKNEKDQQFASKLHSQNKEDYYFAKFDMPALTLIKYKGVGVYESSGYDYDRVKVTEFAVPVSKFKAEYLSDYTLDNHHHENIHELDNLVPMQFDTSLFMDDNNGGMEK